MDSLPLDATDIVYSRIMTSGMLTVFACPPIIAIFKESSISFVQALGILGAGLVVLGAISWSQKVDKEGNTFGWNLHKGFRWWKMPKAEVKFRVFQIAIEWKNKRTVISI